jgi:hypothetical protein
MATDVASLSKTFSASGRTGALTGPLHIHLARSGMDQHLHSKSHRHLTGKLAIACHPQQRNARR